MKMHVLSLLFTVAALVFALTSCDFTESMALNDGDAWKISEYSMRIDGEYGQTKGLKYIGIIIPGDWGTAGHHDVTMVTTDKKTSSISVSIGKSSKNPDEMTVMFGSFTLGGPWTVEKVSDEQYILHMDYEVSGEQHNEYMKLKLLRRGVKTEDSVKGLF